jgi:cytoskeleton protein RodZ
LFEIGSSLREARMRQGLDFPEIEAATKIRGKYLRALEDEQFSQLPAQTYVKGFLRTYAEYLGLDGQLYVDEFNSRYVVGEEEAPPIRARRTARTKQRRRLQSSVLVVALAGIALVTALVIAAWKSGSNETPLVGLGQTTQQQTTTHRARPHGPASITLVAKRDVLLTVRNRAPTGKVLFNDTLAAGEAKHYTTRRLWFQVGTPENLRVTVNTKRVHVPVGGPGVFYVTARGLAAS